MGEVDDHIKRVVLLGESHVKPESMNLLGKRVIEQFRFIGFEGYDPSKLWFGGKYSHVPIYHQRLQEQALSMGYSGSNITGITDELIAGSLDDDVNTIWLEEGHQFDFFENLKFHELILYCIVGPVYFLTFIIHIFYDLPLLLMGVLFLSFFKIPFDNYAASSNFPDFSLKQEKNPLLRSLLFSVNGLTIKRDETHGW